jgi:Flp pilus assembly protein TadD
MRQSVKTEIAKQDVIDQGNTKGEPQLNEAQRLIAQGAIRKALGLEPSDLRLGLDVARNQLQRGDAREAFRMYAALVVCDPSDSELQVGLANCALYMGENALALQAASAIVTLAPSDPRGYFFSGRACLALGYVMEAKEDLTQALEFATRAKNKLIADEAKKYLERIAVLKK